jgi:hypothetical protein
VLKQDVIARVEFDKLGARNKAREEPALHDRYNLVIARVQGEWRSPNTAALLNERRQAAYTRSSRIAYWAI